MHVVIIGNGIAGVTAARHIRKRCDDEITMISAETEHPFSRTALMYIYMGHLKYEHTKLYEDWFWKKNKIDLVQQYVSSIDFENKLLHFSDDDTLTYDKLVIATGSSSNKFGWPGQDLEGVMGLYSFQDLENLENFSSGAKSAVIVGGGLIGIEMAEMLLSRGIKVTFLVREKSFWDLVLPPEESEMINRHIIEHNIDLRLETELKEIIADESGKAKAVITGTGEEIPCQIVGLTAGVHPNVGFLKNTSLEIDRGILVNKYLETNQKDVYAIGDCAQLKTPPKGRQPIEAVWYVGKIMGGSVAKNVCGQKAEYQPGVWFNSAKFLDIEYQTYGLVPPILDDEHETLYWEHFKGKKSIRINYNKASGAVTGFNVLGVRYRQAVCDKWIKENWHIEQVLKNLGAANFDPEFYSSYEKDVVKKYNSQTGKKLYMHQKRGLKSVFGLFKTNQA